MSARVLDIYGIFIIKCQGEPRLKGVLYPSISPFSHIQLICHAMKHNYIIGNIFNLITIFH